MSQPLKLGVNIDHIATIREVRGVSYPDPVDAVKCCEAAGADGITIHLREDRRHIQDHDVYRVSEATSLPINLEMATAPDILAIALETKPAEVCLVPEKREELTTEGGLDVAGHLGQYTKIVAQLNQANIMASMFVEPDRAQLEASKHIGAPCVELHTGAYCNASGAEADALLARLAEGAIIAHELGLQVNAGHGITLENIGAILTIPHLDTLNIGHSIVARAVFVGLEEAVREMIRAMKG